MGGLRTIGGVAYALLIIAGCSSLGSLDDGLLASFAVESSLVEIRSGRDGELTLFRDGDRVATLWSGSASYQTSALHAGQLWVVALVSGEVGVRRIDLTVTPPSVTEVEHQAPLSVADSQQEASASHISIRPLTASKAMIFTGGADTRYIVEERMMMPVTQFRLAEGVGVQLGEPLLSISTSSGLVVARQEQAQLHLIQPNLAISTLDSGPTDNAVASYSTISLQDPEARSGSPVKLISLFSGSDTEVIVFYQSEGRNRVGRVSLTQMPAALRFGQVAALSVASVRIVRASESRLFRAYEVRDGRIWGVDRDGRVLGETLDPPTSTVSIDAPFPDGNDAQLRMTERHLIALRGGIVRVARREDSVWETIHSSAVSSLHPAPGESVVLITNQGARLWRPISWGVRARNLLILFLVLFAIAGITGYLFAWATSKVPSVGGRPNPAATILGGLTTLLSFTVVVDTLRKLSMLPESQVFDAVFSTATGATVFLGFYSATFVHPSTVLGFAKNRPWLFQVLVRVTGGRTLLRGKNSLTQLDQRAYEAWLSGSPWKHGQKLEEAYWAQHGPYLRIFVPSDKMRNALRESLRSKQDAADVVRVLQKMRLVVPICGPKQNEESAQTDLKAGALVLVHPSD